MIAERVSMSTSKTNQDPTKTAGPWRVLLVTDNAVDQKLMSGLLTKHQHRVFVANNGRIALMEWEEKEFDVVLLDALLSEMDGAELTQQIRTREHSLFRVPILVLSDDDTDRERCRVAGADTFLCRPLQVSQFHDGVIAARQRGVTAESSDATPQQDQVDWNVALEAVGGRRDLLIEIVDVFFTEYPTTLTAIQSAIEKGDAKDLQLSAHKLKGCLRYFGASIACEEARALEDMGRAGQLDGAADKLATLTSAVRRLLPQLRQGPS